jgi:hypothetical protein
MGFSEHPHYWTYVKYMARNDSRAIVVSDLDPYVSVIEFMESS